MIDIEMKDNSIMNKDKSLNRLDISFLKLGGLHYCIVLDKFDNPKNGTLNVIPLTSKKNKKRNIKNENR